MKKPVIFPFECALTGQNYNFKGQILNMNQNGFLCNTGNQVVRTSVTMTVKFTLPLTSRVVEVQVISFKTYDKFKGAHNTINPGDHITEFVYKSPTDDFKSMMTQFMAHVQAYLL